jgi:hypothetical protein
MMNGKQANFVAPDHVEDPITVEAFQPDAPHIRKPDGIKQCVGGKRRDDGL